MCAARSGRRSRLAAPRALVTRSVLLLLVASRADAALCSILAFYAGPDPERIERLFGMSRLGDREKWRDRSDYRTRTIAAAIDLIGDRIYTGRRSEIKKGPAGLRIRVDNIHETPTKKVLSITRLTDGGEEHYSISSAETPLDKVAREFLPEAFAVAPGAAMELVLEGLHQHSMVAKEDVQRGAAYTDMMGLLMKGMR